MSILRQKMIEDLQLRGLAVRTQESYVQAVRQLAAHYHKAPDQINEEELRQYFLFLKNVKHVSRSTHTIALCGIKFFYEHTLKREWHTLDFVRPAKEKKLPVVLSMEEVRRIFPFIATCGVEVENTPIDRDDELQLYWLRVISLSIVRLSMQHLRKTIQERYRLEQLSEMNPGSAEAGVWPIEEQGPLFGTLPWSARAGRWSDAV